MMNSHKIAFLAINWETLVMRWKFETPGSRLVLLVLTLSVWVRVSFGVGGNFPLGILS